MGIGEIVSGAIGVASLFGGDGDDGQVQTQNVNTMTPEQAALLKRMSELTLEEIERRPEAYEGQITAGPTQLQQSVFDRVLGTLGEGLPSPLQQQFFGGVGERMGDFIRSPQEVAQQAGGVFEETIGDPSRRAFFEDVAPQLREEFIGQNALSSSGFQRQLAQQGSQLEQGLAAQKAGFIDEADKRRLQDILGISQVAFQEGQIPQQQLSQLLQAASLGEQQRGIEQQDLSSQFSEFLRLNQVPTPALAGILGVPLTASAFQPVVSQQQSSPYGSVLSGLGQSLSAPLGNLAESIFGSIFG